MVNKNNDNRFKLLLSLVIIIVPLPAQILSEYEDIFSSQLFLEPDSLPVYGYTVVNTFPHDSNAFTQGLIYQNNSLYEGTGLYAASTLRKVDLESGTVLKIHYLDNNYFGEGITMWHDTIIQITWREHTGYVYIEQDTFQLVDSFSYTTEGWGLTHDDTCLIMSDGTARIYYLDPHTYIEVGHIDVVAETIPILNLNELEYIQGKIYANVWYSDSIAIIDPATGNVEAWLDLTGILAAPPNVLNGIAYDQENVRLFVTGKLWPALFEIEVDPVNYPPEIIASSPGSPCYIDIDSLLLLTVTVQDPDPQDSLILTWAINGNIDTTAHDTCYTYSSSNETIDTVMFKVDDGMFCDSTEWIIVVSDPGIITETSGIITNTGAFLSCKPNPFRQMTDIRYQMTDGIKRDSYINIYDATGRVVKFFPLLSSYSLVPTAVQWDGTSQVGQRLPAGVYFVMLENENARIREKLIFLH